MSPTKQTQRTQTRLQKYILEDFSGGLHSEGVFTKTKILDTECTSVNNVEFYPIGTISKRKGKLRKHQTPWHNAPISQIYQWWNPSGATYLLTFSCVQTPSTSADIGYFVPTGVDTGTFTSILSSGDATKWTPGLTNHIYLESFAGSAMTVNGVNSMIAWNGGASVKFQTQAPSACQFIKAYKNYLFVANIGIDIGGMGQQTSRVRWSNPLDASSWPTNNYIDLDSDDGDYINGMELIGNELIIFKTRKIYAITFIGGIYTFWSEVRIDGRGCAAGGSIATRYGDLVFYGDDGFYSFNGRDIIELSEKIKDLVLAITPSSRDQVIGAPYEEKDQIWWVVPYYGSATNNVIFVYDYDHHSWSMFTCESASIGWYNVLQDLTFNDMGETTFQTSDIAWGDKVFLSNASVILTGTYDGYLLDNDGGILGVTDDFGNDYSGVWRSRWIDMDEPDLTKRITRITVYVEKQGNYNLTVNVFKDWDNSIIEYTQGLSLQGVTPVLERRLDTTIQARAFQIELRTDLKYQPFTIHKIVVDYYIKGRTVV